MTIFYRDFVEAYQGPITGSKALRESIEILDVLPYNYFALRGQPSNKLESQFSDRPGDSMAVKEYCSIAY
jgi:hypothetical protein